MAKITYADKVALISNSGIADINKTKADDMNEIKNSVNELYEIIDNTYNIIMVGISGTNNYNITSAWGRTKLLFNITHLKIGDKLSLVNGEIVIGAGVSLIELNHKVTSQNSVAAETYFRARKNNGDTVGANSYFKPVVNSFVSASSGITYIEVTEGDVITLTFGAGEVGTLRIAGDGLSYMTVKVIK